MGLYQELSDILGEVVERGATEKARTYKTGSGTMSASSVRGKDVTAWNIETADGVKVAVIVSGGPKADNPRSKGVAEIIWPKMKADGFRPPVLLSGHAALKLKGEIPLCDLKDLPDLVRKLRTKSEELDGFEEAAQVDLERPAQDVLNLSKDLYRLIGRLESAAKRMKEAHPQLAGTVLKRLDGIDIAARKLATEIEDGLGIG